jgi:TfoX/Sxy family transcriptional regulator of competence genes
MSTRKLFTSLELLREELVFTATLFGTLGEQSLDAQLLNEIDPSPKEVFRDALKLEDANEQDLVEFIDSLRIRSCRGEYLLTQEAIVSLYSDARYICKVRIRSEDHFHF